jgi:hypothetical protein
MSVCALGVSDNVKACSSDLLSAPRKLAAFTTSEQRVKWNQPELLITESSAWSPLVPFLVPAMARFLK